MNEILNNGGLTTRRASRRNLMVHRWCVRLSDGQRMLWSCTEGRFWANPNREK